MFFSVAATTLTPTSTDIHIKMDSLRTIPAYRPLWPDRDAVPFIMREGGAYMYGPVRQTEACQYWLKRNYFSRDSSFIAHFKWEWMGHAHQLSRVEVIHSWLEAYNLVSDIIRVKNLVDEARLAGDKIIYRDDMEQQQLAGLVQYMRKIQRLHEFTSIFLKEVNIVEESRTIPDTWEGLPIPACEFDQIALDIDTGASLAIKPYKVISALKQLVADSTQLSILYEFCVRFQVELPKRLTGPEGPWYDLIAGQDHADSIHRESFSFTSPRHYPVSLPVSYQIALVFDGEIQIKLSGRKIVSPRKGGYERLRDSKSTRNKGEEWLVLANCN